VTARRADGGLRNPLYLHGDMAVQPGRKIGEPVRSATFGDLAAAGLPYACGTLAWEADVVLPAPPDAAQVALRLPQLSVDAYEIALDDGSWQAVAWAPRRAVLPAWQPGLHRLRVLQHVPLSHCFHGEGWDATVHSVIVAVP